MASTRSTALNDVALSLGFKFEADDWAFGGLFSQIDIPLFTRPGNIGTISNILTGQLNGIGGKFFDFSMTVAGEYWPIKQTLASFTPERPLPQFTVAPMDLAHRISGLFTQQAVNVHLPGSPQRIWISGTDEDRIRAAFNPNLVEFLTVTDQAVPWHFEGCPKALVLYRIGHLAKPEEYAEFIDSTASLAKTFLALYGPATAA